MRPRPFIYLDREGIDSLYAQTVDRVETEFTQSLEKDRANKVAGKFGFGQLLATLFGLSEATVEAERSHANKNMEQAKYSLTTEQKIISLVDFLDSLEEMYLVKELI